MGKAVNQETGRRSYSEENALLYRAELRLSIKPSILAKTEVLSMSNLIERAGSIGNGTNRIFTLGISVV